jgi:AAA domain
VTLRQFLPIDEQIRKEAYRAFATHFLKRGVPCDVLIAELARNGAMNAGDVVPEIRGRLMNSDDDVEAYLGRHIIRAYAEQFGVEGHLPFLTEADLLAEEPAPELVDGLLVQGSIFMIFGPKNMGKTFLNFDLAYRLATKQATFLGRSIHRHGHVVMIVAEGGSRLNVRAQAWRNEHRVTMPADISFLKRSVDLRNQRDVDALIATVAPLNPVLITFDTLSRNMPGAVENSAEDMTVAIATLDRLRAEVPGVTIGVLHHPTKANDDIERGSSAFTGAVDTVISARFEQGVRMLYCKYQRDVEPFEPIPYELQTVDVSQYRDREGHAYTSCIVGHLTGEQAARAREASSALQVLIIRRLETRPMSGTELQEALNKKRDAVQTACKELAAAGRIRSTGKGPNQKWEFVRQRPLPSAEVGI